MKNILAIAAKDLRSQFVSPIAYVVLTGFLLLGGWFFFNLLARFNFLLQLYLSFRNPEAMERLNLNEFVIAPLLHNLSVVLVILVPVITMRSFAEEKRSGTYELLMTSPLSITEIVLGKFLGAFVFVLRHGAADRRLSADPRRSTAIPRSGVILSGYLGLLLLATAFVSVGLLTSSFTENQIIAAVSCLVGAAAAVRHLVAGGHRRRDDGRGAQVRLADRALRRDGEGRHRHARPDVLRQRHRPGPLPHPALGRVAALEIARAPLQRPARPRSASSCCVFAGVASVLTRGATRVFDIALHRRPRGRSACWLLIAYLSTGLENLRALPRRALDQVRHQHGRRVAHLHRHPRPPQLHRLPRTPPLRPHLREGLQPLAAVGAGPQRAHQGSAHGGLRRGRRQSRARRPAAATTRDASSKVSYRLVDPDREPELAERYGIKALQHRAHRSTARPRTR